MTMHRFFKPHYLPYFGALVQAVLFSLAGSLVFGEYGWIAGLGVGAVVNYSLALASSRLADVAANRQRLARLALIGLFLLSPITISLSYILPDSVFSVIAWAMCVDLAIILAGFIAGKSLIPAQPKAADAKNRSAKTSGKNKPLSKKGKLSAAYPCPFTANGCLTKKATQNAINAHAGKCKHKPMVADKTIFIKEDVKK